MMSSYFSLFVCPCDCSSEVIPERSAFETNYSYDYQSLCAMATVKMLLVLVLLVGASRATTTPTPSPSPDPEPKWNCPEVSAQANASVEQINGEWFVLELDGSPPAKPRNACSVLSVTGPRDEGNNSFSVVLSIRIPPSDQRASKDAYYHRDKPQEFVFRDPSSVWRLHSLSDDGQVLVLVTCNMRNPDAVFRMTLGASANVNPPSRAANSSSSVVRRDDNFCKELEVAGAFVN